MRKNFEENALEISPRDVEKRTRFYEKSDQRVTKEDAGVVERGLGSLVFLGATRLRLSVPRTAITRDLKLATGDVRKSSVKIYTFLGAQLAT